jgi:hypothetical protein
MNGEKCCFLTAMELYCLEKDKSATFSCILYIGSEPPPLISGEQKSNGGLVHLYLKGLNKSKRVSGTKLLEGLLTVLSFTLFSPRYVVRSPKLSARQRPKPMPIGR